MSKSEVSVTTGVRYDAEDPFIETRARVVRSADGSLPEGRVYVFKTPILPPGASDEEVRAATTMQIFDVDPRPGASTRN